MWSHILEKTRLAVSGLRKAPPPILVFRCICFEGVVCLVGNTKGGTVFGSFFSFKSQKLKLRLKNLVTVSYVPGNSCRTFFQFLKENCMDKYIYIVELLILYFR